MKKTIKYLVVGIALVSFAIAGCAADSTPQPTATTPTQPTPTQTSPTQSGDEVYDWRLQSIFGSGEPAFELTEEMCENITVASNGRVNVTAFPNGSIVGSMEGFQACGDGVFEMHESWSSYAAGIDAVFRSMSGQAMGMQGYDHLVWIYEGGGKAIYEKALRENLNLHVLAFEAWPSEAAQGNTEVRSMSDFIGKKFRTGDPRWGKNVGVDSVVLPLEDTFTALQTGAVDIAEFGSLAYNVGLGLTDITKYTYWPDFWNVCTIAQVVVNIDAWNELPEDLQKIVEMCARANEMPYYTRYQYLSALKYQELRDQGGMEFIRLPAEDMYLLREAMDKVEQEEYASSSDIHRELYDSYWAFKQLYFPYRTITNWWGEGATVEDQLGMLAE